MKTNTPEKRPQVTTHEGAKARHVKPHDELRRAVMSCLLWEGEFYESGESIADRISTLSTKVAPETVAQIARECRLKANIRHAPLMLALGLVGRHDFKRADYIGLVNDITKRPDDVTELLSLYWRGGKKKIAMRLRMALGASLRKFDSYQLSKYAAQGAVRLRDVLFLSHPKPDTKEQEALWKQLADDTLPTADTWESKLSAGADKASAFTDLLKRQKMGGLGVLRNLRNMKDAGVDRALVKAELLRLAPKSGILPYQFISAARAVPAWEDLTQEAMLASLQGMPKLPGKTIVVVDTSGSMHHGGLGGKSDLRRIDAAAALAAMAQEICEDGAVYCTAGNDGTRVHATTRVPSSRRGMALIDYITGEGVRRDIGGGGIFLKQCMDWIEKDYNGTADRVIVFTDEQDCDLRGSPAEAKLLGTNNYMMNVASYNRSIAYGKWVTLSGFSENLLRYVRAYEGGNEVNTESLQ